jgi:hypothetical protein
VLRSAKRAVVDPSPALRRDGEADREVRSADPGRPVQNHVLATFDEAELVQTLDLLAAQRGLKDEVQVLVSLCQVAGGTA